jgi:glycosyltransferase involved in cell wall biosynthesis
MARPLIASDVPGCRSVLDNSTTGLLCLARSIESLAEACSAFLALAPEAQSAMGLAGRAKMEVEFDQVRVIQAYRDAIALASAGKGTAQTA